MDKVSSFFKPKVFERSVSGQAAAAKTKTIYKTGVKAKYITATQYEDQTSDYVGYKKVDFMVDDEVTVKKAVQCKQNIEYSASKNLLVHSCE